MLMLSPETEALIQGRIDSGRFQNADQLIQEAIAELDARDQQESILQTEVLKGFDQLDRGEGMLWSADLKNQLRATAEENARLGKPINDVIKP